MFREIIYLLIKYIKSVLWRVAKCLSYIEEARCLKVKHIFTTFYARVAYSTSRLSKTTIYLQPNNLLQEQ